jgi:hypothetical protein
LNYSLKSTPHHDIHRSYFQDLDLSPTPHSKSLLFLAFSRQSSAITKPSFAEPLNDGTAPGLPPVTETFLCSVILPVIVTPEPSSLIDPALPLISTDSLAR